MVKEIHSIRATSTTDAGLLEECKQEIEKCNCDSITWSEPTKGSRIDPPSNTVAVVVNLVENIGAIRIYEKDGTYVNGIGTNESGHRVIIPWNNNWWFYIAGNIKVGLVFGN